MDKTIIGISGGPNVYGSIPTLAGLSPFYFHDGACAIVRAGEVVFCAEDERFTRNKHSHFLPLSALQYGLQRHEIPVAAIERVAFPFTEDFCDGQLRRASADLGMPPLVPFREVLGDHLEWSIGLSAAADKVAFVPHHVAHATAASVGSGFQKSLVVVIDGLGESESISIFTAEGTSLSSLHSYGERVSLGFFYHRVTQLLGFSPFDEYKVMGLAPYGDAARFRSEFAKLLEMRDGGDFTLDLYALPLLACRLALPGRQRGVAPMQIHCDFAAAAQELLEVIVSDILQHWVRKTGHESVCLVGGVAQNCAMNGKLVRQEKFKSMYVHPASHDAGTALGAALSLLPGDVPTGKSKKQFSPLLGATIDARGDAATMEALSAWKQALSWHRPDEAYAETAAAIAGGAIIGWARGPAEFGPRALGNRSILADPRPASNRDRINRAIKKREDFRPFAPAVLQESAHRFFEMPLVSCNLGEMTFTVPVQLSQRQNLGAVTHVDGTARIQVVSSENHLDFHSLISEFERITGTGVLLNTSLNNNYEPIANSASDVVRTFLMTELDMLVIGPYLVRKKAPLSKFIKDCSIDRMWGTRVSQALGETLHNSVSSANQMTTLQVGFPLLERLLKMEGKTAISDLLFGLQPVDSESVVKELLSLWEANLIIIYPP